MPWYTNPSRTSKVLHRIANRHSASSLTDLKSTIDSAAEMLWKKQEHYYRTKAGHHSNSMGNQE